MVFNFLFSLIMLQSACQNEKNILKKFINYCNIKKYLFDACINMKQGQRRGKLTMWVFLTQWVFWLVQ